MIFHSNKTRPPQQNISSFRGTGPKTSAHWGYHLIFVSCAVALGCSSHGDADGELEAMTRAPLIASASATAASLPAAVASPASPLPSPAPMIVLVPSSRPSTVTLGTPFTARVRNVSASGTDTYAWSGEGVSVAPGSGSSATLTCIWSGFHTIEVRVNGASARTAQIDCRPPLCEGGAPCPGVHAQGTACPHTNAILRVSGDNCPKPLDPRWTRELLIPHADGDESARFCGYTWNGSINDEPPSPLPAKSFGTAWAWDCPRVSGATSGELTSGQFNEVLANKGREGLGTLTWLPSVTIPPPVPTPVRIAVVDTAAGTWSDPDNNPHGKAVGTLALDTACSDQASCPVRVENYLGLPLYRDPNSTGGPSVRRDIIHGGSFGAHSDLVHGIVAAVRADPSTPMVLNLSLAFEPEPQDMPADEFVHNAVLDALYYARCSGALILAAAGNGPVPAKSGQLPGLPARWTNQRALNTGECQTRFGFAQNSDIPGPLLYAVSGLDFGGQPLLTTRGSGQSMFAALGFEAVRQEPNDGPYTRRMTGTSMATATISGIAALLWSHKNSLTPDQLMNALYAGEGPTGIAANFAPIGTALGEAHRITRCSIANAFDKLASCIGPKTALTIPAGTVPQFAVAPQPGSIGPVTEGARPEDFPWLFPQPTPEPSCGVCTLVPGQLSLSFRISFPALTVPYMRLLARTSIQSGAGFKSGRAGAVADTGADAGDELHIADITDPQSAPFGVLLGAEFDTTTAAELSYPMTVDGTDFDITESVLIQQADQAETGGAGGTGGAVF